MNLILARSLKLWGLLLVFSLAASAQAATFSIKAVAVNGVRFPPTNHVTVDPGDTIECEIYISGWADDDFCFPSPRWWPPPIPCTTDSDCEHVTEYCVEPRVRIYQATLDPNSYLSGKTGAVLPLGWPYTPGSTAFIDEQRTDFIFYDVGQMIAAVDLYDPMRFGGIMFDEEGVADPGFPLYLGTLTLAASDASSEHGRACGMFPVGFFDDYHYCADTFFATQYPERVCFEPRLEPLIIDVTCEEVAACCVQGACHQRAEADCLPLGGIWHPAKRCEQDGFTCPSLKGTGQTGQRLRND